MRKNRALRLSAVSFLDHGRNVFDLPQQVILSNAGEMDVYFATSQGSNQKLTKTSMPYQIEKVSDLYIKPSVVSLGVRPIGEMIVEDIEITSLSGASLSGIDVRISGDDIEMSEIAENNANKSIKRYRIKYRISKNGPLLAKIEFAQPGVVQAKQNACLHIMGHGVR